MNRRQDLISTPTPQGDRGFLYKEVGAMEVGGGASEARGP